MTLKDEIREQLSAGKTAREVIDQGYTSSTVYLVARELRDADQNDTVDDGKRVGGRPVSQIEQPEAETDGEGGASAGGDDVEYLRARNAELTEHVVDMSIELVRLQRLLRAQQEG